MKRIWCNGDWIHPKDFPQSPLDRGAMLGLGLFETILAVDGVAKFADRHLARLRQGCERLGWKFEMIDFDGIATELLEKNQLGHGRARIRLAVTGGSGPLRDLTAGIDRVVWMTALVGLVPPETLSACISPWPRNEHSPLVGLKCASYAENCIALDHARRLGFDEAIFFNTASHLCEAATANIFIVKNGRLSTPSLESGCLPGIGREVVIERAHEMGISLEAGVLTREDLIAADEIFLTSSTRGPVPLVLLEDKKLSVGSVVRRLLEFAW